MKNLVVFSLLCFCIALRLSSAMAQQPKYSNEFLHIGVGAKGLALSHAVTATNNDVYSPFWNPAGLTQCEKKVEIGVMYANYFAGLASYNYGGLAAKLDDKSSFGISFVRFGVDNIPNTSELIDSDGYIDTDKITAFSASDNAFLFTYARKAKREGLRYGVNAKIIYRQVGSFATAWGFGLDAGMQYEHKRWHMGVFAKDVSTTPTTWVYTFTDNYKQLLTLTGNEIPLNGMEVSLPQVILACAKEVNWSAAFSTLVEIDGKITFDGQRNTPISQSLFSIEPYGGLGLSYKKMVFLRFGVGNIQQEVQPQGDFSWQFQLNSGLGIKINNLQLDYAYTNLGNNGIALYSNIVSLKLGLNRSDEKSK